MDAQELRNLQEAYMEVYQELDEVVGRGKIDPIDPEDAGVSRETGARSPRQAGLRMPPLERAKLRSKALSKRSDPNAKKRGKDILTRFVNPTERGIDRAINTAGETTAAISQRRRERQSGNVHESYDIYDVILSHLLDEGYAETPEAAEAIMVNMSEEWREDIIDEGFKRMNRTKIEKQAKKLGGDRGDILLNIASKMDTPAERKYSILQARRNRAGSGSYRQAKALQARDDAQADIEKYGLH